jgi:hypothetical protein
MAITLRCSHLTLVFILTWAACMSGPDFGDVAEQRATVAQQIQQQTGAPVSLELGASGDTRVLAMTPQFPMRGRSGDPASAAREFLASYHGAFQLDPDAATEFIVTRTDDDQTTGLRHVTLNRVHDGIPVFQGAITVHMDSGNRIFRALGDEFYRISEPTNRRVLSPGEAVVAAGRGLGVALLPTWVSDDGQISTFESPAALDPIRVEPRIVQASPDDFRHAYQVVVSWIDSRDQQQQSQLALVDAATGALLAAHSLVNTFIGRVFTASPGANPTGDTRVLVSFDGNAAASPQGWVGTARSTLGNNASVATDLDFNNTVGTNEIRPVASTSNSFDFPFSPAQNASSFAQAAVTNAFYLVNSYHDRLYQLGFTESSGNFQTSNFGKGGAQNDPLNVDVQDGAATNNANFATPPDGMSPRMQLFLFTMNGGVQEDAAFDPSVVYHEATHGVSNRLVGGGSTACLLGLQSGGMGEGWSDFMAASFLNNPVIGAYVTGGPTVGIRQASMANSPFTFNHVRTGALVGVHAVGELWAATLWDVRKQVGQTVVERLVVAGMKLTPCNPTMLQARDAILQADINLYAGTHRCQIWQAFAARQMGISALSPNHNSGTQVVPSANVPADCTGGIVRWSSTASPNVATVDHGTVCTSATVVTTSGDASRARLDITGSHAYRAILRGTLSHNGALVDAFVPDTFPLRAGSFSFSQRVIPGLVGSAAGTWTLCIVDTDTAGDTGRLTSWSVHD